MILWCGGEDIDFPFDKVGLTINTGTGFRSGIARLAIADVGSGWAYSKSFTDVTSAWFSFYFGGATWTTGKLLAGLTNAGTKKGIYIGSDSTSTSRVAVYTYDGTTSTKLAAETGTSLGSGVKKIDMSISGFGGTCAVKVYVNTVLVIDYSGTVAISGITGLNTVTLVPGSGTGVYLSEFIVADEDTRLMSLKTLAPNADGDASGWTNGYANIDEITNSDADTVYSGTADQEFQCNLTGMPAGDYICKGVKVAARMTDGVGGMDVQMGVRTNSTTSLGSAVGIDSVWKTYEAIYQENPVTSNRFTPEEIEALQLAFKSVAV